MSTLQMGNVVNVAGYKFVTLSNLPRRREQFHELCSRLKLKGTILLSTEGLNLFVAGSRESIDQLLAHVRSEPRFADFEVKESFSDVQPFVQMQVRIRPEIIAFGVNSINPRKHTSPRISANQLKQWLDEGKSVVLLDTRNDYETQLGTFAGATQLNLKHFRDFPEAVHSLPEELKQQPIVTFCTGGIRCEKAAPLLEQQGFREVYQLDGGILKYFEECGDAHYQGDCFVFDRRIALNAKLEESEDKICFQCKADLSEEDLQSEKYIPFRSCPHCFEDEEGKMDRLLLKRHEQIQLLITPLPGSVPYDNRRPVSIPERCDRWRLIDVLSELHPHVGRANWQSLCDVGHILQGDIPVSGDKVVRAGERYSRLFPGITEPDVNGDVRVLYEDEWIVAVDKPAPLPMHPCGQFNRNTLTFILNEIYAPQKLRPAHRLDANTSGVVLFCRTRAIASVVQPQFEDREVKKTYLARVHGHPVQKEYLHEARISTECSKAGCRWIDPEGMEAKTEIRVLERLSDGTSLVEARPITGRTNQIRLHLWDLGHAICGDPLYLRDRKFGEIQTLKVNDPPMCLRARRLELTHPITESSLILIAPLPEWAPSTEVENES